MSISFGVFPSSLFRFCRYLSITFYWPLLFSTGHNPRNDSYVAFFIFLSNPCSTSIPWNIAKMVSSTSAQCKMVWMSQLNNSATLNSYTDPSRCSQMLLDKLRAKRWTHRCSETASPVPLNALTVVQQNTRTSWEMYGCLRNATKSNYWNVQSSELLGVLAESPGLFHRISNLEPSSPGVTIIMVISHSTIQLTNYLSPARLDSGIVK